MHVLPPIRVWAMINGVLLSFCWVSELPHKCYSIATHIQFCHRWHILLICLNIIYHIYSSFSVLPVYEPTPFASIVPVMTIQSPCFSLTQPLTANAVPFLKDIPLQLPFLAPDNTINSWAKLLITHNICFIHQTQHAFVDVTIQWTIPMNLRTILFAKSINMFPINY